VRSLPGKAKKKLSKKEQQRENSRLAGESQALAGILPVAAAALVLVALSYVVLRAI